MKSGHIRAIDISRDLNAVADLIELCFRIHLDRDGQTYIRQMRKAARELQFLHWTSALTELRDTRIPGFVWEEGGAIIGNLSLIPFTEQGQKVHLIANVAVHPSYRRRGIARALTEYALEYLHRHQEPHVWLQVRDDNSAAYNLYKSTGFKEVLSRTTWRMKPADFQGMEAFQPSGLTIRHRRRGDWNKQKAWLAVTYPPVMRWNLPVNFQHFEPGSLQWVFNLLNNIHLRHWAFEADGRFCGTVTWQKTRSFAHNLWLAFPEDREQCWLPAALKQTFQHLAKKHFVSVDYPKGRSRELFEQLGFFHFRTLIWMRCLLT